MLRRRGRACTAREHHGRGGGLVGGDRRRVDGVAVRLVTARARGRRALRELPHGHGLRARRVCRALRPICRRVGRQRGCLQAEQWWAGRVATAGPRIQVLRFSLLIVLTVALLSVAIRIHDRSSSNSSATNTRPPASGQPSTGQPSSGQPSTGTSSPPVAVLPTSSSRPTPSGTTTGGAGGAGGPTGSGSGGAAGSGGSAGAAGQPTLPRTGWDGPIRYGGLAVLLLVGGAVALGAAGPRRRPSGR